MRMKPIVPTATAFAAFFALAVGEAQAAPIFIGVHTFANSAASLQVGGATASNVVNDQSSAATFSPTVSATSTYTAQVAGYDDLATDTSTASLTLTSASSGVAELKSSAALNLITPGAVGGAYTSGALGLVNGPLGGYVVYGFMDPRPFRVTIDYDDVQQGSESAYFGPYTSTQGGGLLGPGTYPTNGAGSFSQTFGGGYLQLEFYDDVYSADALAATGPAALSSNTDYKFSFSITGVPEPMTWTLMFVGFGFMGAGLRARRVGRAVAT